jgi:hypothetical protein
MSPAKGLIPLLAGPPPQNSLNDDAGKHDLRIRDRYENHRSPKILGGHSDSCLLSTCLLLFLATHGGEEFGV